MFAGVGIVVMPLDTTQQSRVRFPAPVPIIIARTGRRSKGGDPPCPIRSRSRAVGERRVGLRVRALRATHGLTQLGLARRSGISRPSVANVEAGRQNVSLHNLFALADALGVEVEELLARNGVRGDGPAA